MDKVKLGKRIREVRKSKGLAVDTLTELSKLTSDSYIRMIEGGTKTPSLKTFVAICNALTISSDYLLADSLVELSDLPVEVSLKDKLKLLSPADIELLDTIAAKMIMQAKDNMR